MKTKELLDKYKKIICPILKCDEKDLKFFISGRGDTWETRSIEDEIGELEYKKDSNWGLGTYTLKCKDKIVSHWKLYEMPHCCAYMISCNVEVITAYRNKRIGTILNSLRQDIGRLLGYSALLCTDIEKNIYQRKLLETNGWRDVHNVINKRTQNRVYLSVINL